jgi:elongator complex protein 4
MSTVNGSFRRKGAPSLSLKGAKISAYNSEYLVSSGIPSFDDVVGGGGIPIHTLTMLKGDQTGYAQLMLKFFFAQGLASQQPVMFVSPEDDPEAFVRELPLVVRDSITEGNLFTQNPVL